MSKLDEMLAAETRLSDIAATGNTIAGAFAAHLLLIIGAVKEIPSAGTFDASPIVSRVDTLESRATDIASRVSSLTDGVTTVAAAVDKLAGRVALIENAISVFAAANPPTPAPAAAPAPTADPAPAAPAADPATIQPTV